MASLDSWPQFLASAQVVTTVLPRNARGDMADDTIDLTGGGDTPSRASAAAEAPTTVQVAPLPTGTGGRVIVDPSFTARTDRATVTRPGDQAVPAKPDYEYEAPGSTLGIFALIIGLAALLAFRRPTGISQSTLWAQDATELIGGWLNGAGGLFGPIQTLFSPADGQLWPLQRLMAGVVTLLPTSWWAVSLYLLTCVVAASAIGVVLQRRAVPVLGGWGWRIAIAVALALLPAVWEVQGNLVNLQYYMAGSLLVLLVLPRPRTRAGRVVELLWVAMVAMSGLLGLVLVPLALWMLLPSRGDNGRAGAGAYVRIRSAVAVVFAAIGAYVWFSQSRGVTESLGTLVDFPQIAFQRVGGSLGLGQEALDGGWMAGWPLTALVVSAAVLFALGVLVVVDWRGPSPWWLVAGLGMLLVGLLAGAHGSLTGSQALLSASFGNRYAFFALFAAVLIAGRALAVGEGGQRIFAGVLVGLCVGAFLSDAKLDPAGPALTAEQITSFNDCLVSGPTAQAPCTLPVAPEGWTLTVSAE